MAYAAPSLSELLKLIDDLEKDYKNSNPQRLSFLTLLKTVANTLTSAQDSTARKVILGALIVEMGILENETYFNFEPRSTMYKQIKEGLKLTKDNQFGDDERLIYTHALYDHVNKLFTDNTMQFMFNQRANIKFAWKNKDALLNAIHARMKAIRWSDSDKINRLVHARPTLEALRTGTKKLAAEYQKLANAQTGRWSFFKRDPKRDQLTNFINLVDKSCRDLFEKNESSAMSEELRHQLMNDEIAIRRGLLLFALLQVENNSWVSPEGGWFTSGSNLFKQTLAILNVDHLKDIPAAEKADLIRALQKHLQDRRENPANWQAFLKRVIEENITPLDSDKELYLDNIQSYLVTQDRLRYEPQGRAGVASTAVGYATQSTTTYVLSNGAGSYVAKGMLGAAAMSLGGVPAVAVYAGGTLIMTGLSGLIGERLVSAVTANLYEWLLDKIGASVGSVAAGVFNFSNEVSNETIYALRVKLQPSDEKLFCDWVNALLDLPLDIVSSKEKECIRKVLGLQPDCMLLPLCDAAATTSTLRMGR